MTQQTDTAQTDRQTLKKTDLNPDQQPSYKSAKKMLKQKGNGNKKRIECFFKSLKIV